MATKQIIIMNKITENNIIDTLKNYSEIPSDRCWESIANNLPITTPQITNNPQIPQSGLSNFFNSLMGKIVLAAISLATISTIATIIYYPKQENINNSKVENIINSSDTSNISTNSISPANNNTNSYNAKEEFTNTQSTETTIPQSIAQTQHEIINPINITETTSNNTTKPEVVNNETTDKTEVIHENTENSETIISEVNTEKNATPIETINVDILKRPNVFTPNGDGYNDYLVFENIESFPKNRLIIINSNGVKVFEQNQYNNSWDGNNVPDGTYFYILEVNNGQKTVSMYGNIQILR